MHQRRETKRTAKRRRKRSRRLHRRPAIELLEDRRLLATASFEFATGKLTVEELDSQRSVGVGRGNGGEVVVDNIPVVVTPPEPPDSPPRNLLPNEVKHIVVTSQGGTDLSEVTKANGFSPTEVEITAAGIITGSEFADQIDGTPAGDGEQLINAGPGDDVITDTGGASVVVIGGLDEDTINVVGRSTYLWTSGDGDDTIKVQDNALNKSFDIRTRAGELQLESAEDASHVIHRRSSVGPMPFPPDGNLAGFAYESLVEFGNTRFFSSGLSDIDDRLASEERSFVWEGDGADNVTLRSSPAVNIDDGTNVSFKPPTKQLTIRTGPGADQFTLESWDQETEELHIHGDDGDDRLDASALVAPADDNGGGQSADDTRPIGLNLYGDGDNDTLIGGGGHDRLEGAAGDDTFVVVERWGIDGIIAGTGQDTLDLSALEVDLEITIGSNAEVADGKDNNVQDVGAELEEIIAGKGADRFIMLDGQAFAGGNGTLDGGLDDKPDVLDFSRWQVPVEVSLADGQASSPSLGKIASLARLQHVIGGQSGDVLVGDEQENMLEGGPGEDTIDGRQGADKLFGGPDDDTFILRDGWGVDEVRDASGNDTLQAEVDEPVTFFIVGSDPGAEAEEAELMVLAAQGDNQLLASLMEIENLAGGPRDDLFQFNAFGALSGKIDGRGGSDWLDYSAVGTGVQVILQSQPAAPGDPLVGLATKDPHPDPSQRQFNEIVDIENVKTGSGRDFIAGSIADNQLMGGSGSDHYEILFSGVAGGSQGWGTDTISDSAGDDDALSVDVNLDLIFRIGQGVVEPRATLGEAEDPPAGPSFLSFAPLSIESFEGGDGDDVFTFPEGVEIPGDLSGGGGADTLDYSAYTTPVFVDLETGVEVDDGDVSIIGRAPGTKQVRDFENVVGGNADDRIFGSSQANFLSGGDGSDVLDADGTEGDDFEQVVAVAGGQIASTTAEGEEPEESIDELIGGNGIDFCLNADTTEQCEWIRTVDATTRDFRTVVIDYDLVDERGMLLPVDDTGAFLAGDPPDIPFTFRVFRSSDHAFPDGLEVNVDNDGLSRITADRRGEIQLFCDDSCVSDSERFLIVIADFDPSFSPTVGNDPANGLFVTPLIEFGNSISRHGNIGTNSESLSSGSLDNVILRGTSDFDSLRPITDAIPLKQAGRIGITFPFRSDSETLLEKLDEDNLVDAGLLPAIGDLMGLLQLDPFNRWSMSDIWLLDAFDSDKGHRAPRSLHYAGRAIDIQIPLIGGQGTLDHPLMQRFAGLVWLAGFDYVENEVTSHARQRSHIHASQRTPFQAVVASGIHLRVKGPVEVSASTPVGEFMQQGDVQFLTLPGFMGESDFRFTATADGEMILQVLAADVNGDSKVFLPRTNPAAHGQQGDREIVAYEITEGQSIECRVNSSANRAADLEVLCKAIGNVVAAPSGRRFEFVSPSVGNQLSAGNVGEPEGDEATVVLLVDDNPEPFFEDIRVSDVQQIILEGGPEDNVVDLRTVTAAHYTSLIDVTAVGGEGSDEIFGSEIFDVLLGGSGDDTLNLGPGEDFLDGEEGFDTLRVTGANVTLDLTQIANERIAGIEQLDIRGSGANTLRLDADEVLNASDESDELAILAGTDDMVDFGGGWTLTATRAENGTFYRVLEQSGATLLLNGPFNYQNPVDPHDVNFNGFSVESVGDILRLINELNGPTFIDASGRLPALPPDPFPGFFDINGDGFLSAVGDLLRQVNRAIEQFGGEGEGAAEGLQVSQSVILRAAFFVQHDQGTSQTHHKGRDIGRPGSSTPLRVPSANPGHMSALATRDRYDSYRSVSERRLSAENVDALLTFWRDGAFQGILGSLEPFESIDDRLGRP